MLILLMALLALMCQNSIKGKSINNIAGPYIAYAERFYLCEAPNRPLPWRWHFRASHFNPHRPKEIQLLTGNVTGANVTFDNSCWVKAVMDVRANNQWKENAFIFNFKKKGCQVVKENMPAIYNHFFKKTEINGVCLVPPGVYEGTNVPIEWNFPNVPIITYGHYKFKLMAGIAGNTIGCWAVESNFIPKPA